MAERSTQQRVASKPPAAAPGRAVAGPRQGALAQLAAAVNGRGARAANRTGLPDQLKAGVEALSGVSMDSVRVHRDSARPAAVQAVAYAQGQDIHLAPGQERHLPHEAWHVAQQAQGRVRPTGQTESGVAVNDDAGLEREADRMGSVAARATAVTDGQAQTSAPGPAQRKTIQRQVTSDGTPISDKALEAELRSRVASLKLKKAKEDKLIAERLRWADELDQDFLSVEVVDLLNAKSYEALVGHLKVEAASKDTELGTGSHAYARHSAVTKTDMAARIGGRVDVTTKLKDQDAYERFVEDLKTKIDPLEEVLTEIGNDIQKEAVASLTDPTNDAIVTEFRDRFAGGRQASGLVWKLQGQPTIERRAGGVVKVMMAWQANSTNRYRKLRVTAGGVEEQVSEPITIYGGTTNMVGIVVNCRDPAVAVAVQGLGDELKFETVF